MQNLFITLTSLAEGVGNAASAIDRIFMIFMGILIAIAILLLIISFRIRTKGYRIFLGIMCLIFLAICVLCFQHEVSAYKTGTTLLIITIIGVASIFLKSKNAEK